MSVPLAPDDVVRTFADVPEHARPPLLVLEPLREYLDAHGIATGDDLDPRPLGDGHSNVTVVISLADTELVLRRPPRPPLPPSAHDVLREARLLTALEGRAVRIPRVVLACADESIIGAPFYLMERVDGFVLTDSIPGILKGEEAAVSDELIDALVELHAVDWTTLGLERFGQPDGYLERQIRRFRGLWEVNKTRELDAVERVATWLGDNMPASGPASIVHGDYRLGNTIYAPSAPAHLSAIFDWELTTLGDPLADLGYLCALWAEPGDPPSILRDHVGGASRQPGFHSRDEMVARYEEQTRRSVRDIRWYRALALWKAIVFMEGNHRRAITGATDDPYLLDFGDGVIALADEAQETAFAGHT